MRSKFQFPVSIAAALMAIVLLLQWAGIGGFGSPSVAMAQIPDSGAQRAQIIEQLKQINASLDKITAALAGGKVQAHPAETDDKKTD